MSTDTVQRTDEPLSTDEVVEPRFIDISGDEVDSEALVPEAWGEGATLNTTALDNLSTDPRLGAEVSEEDFAAWFAHVLQLQTPEPPAA